MPQWKHQNNIRLADISNYMAAVGSGVQQPECKINDMTDRKHQRCVRHNNLKYSYCDHWCLQPIETMSLSLSPSQNNHFSRKKRSLKIIFRRSLFPEIRLLLHQTQQVQKQNKGSPQRPPPKEPTVVLIPSDWSAPRVSHLSDIEYSSRRLKINPWQKIKKRLQDNVALSGRKTKGMSNASQFRAWSAFPSD